MTGAQAGASEELAPDEAGEVPSSISCKVKLSSYQRLNYYAMKRSMQVGQRVTLSKVAGEVLDKAAEQLDEPPEDLLS